MGIVCCSISCMTSKLDRAFVFALQLVWKIPLFMRLPLGIKCQNRNLLGFKEGIWDLVNSSAMLTSYGYQVLPLGSWRDEKSLGLYGNLKIYGVIKTAMLGSDVIHQGIHVFSILALAWLNYWSYPPHSHWSLHKHSLKQQKSTDPHSGCCPTWHSPLPTVWVSALGNKDAHSTLQSSEAVHRTSNLFLLAVCSHSLTQTGCSSLFTSGWPPTSISPCVSAHRSRGYKLACVCDPR